MSSRSQSLAALTLGACAVLGTLTLAYGLVYPSGSHASKAPLALAIAGGTGSALWALLLGVAAHRRASKDSERFFALLAVLLGAYFVFVTVLGFGIPVLVLGVRD